MPPFETVSGLDSPEALLLYLLENEHAPFAKPESPRGRRAAAKRELTSFWIHGQTLLELRQYFGEALAGYAGYREFADRRLLDEYRREMRELLEEASHLPPEQLAALREAMDDPQVEARPADRQRFLAEWLGDISAYDLVTGLEARAANHLLDPRQPAARTARLVSAVESHWREFGEWFPPPTRVRIITPLIPAFDPQRELVGFYRILLPQVDSRGRPPPDRVPEAPLGLTFLRQVIASAGEPPGVDGRLDVRAISYQHPRNRIRRRIVRQAKKRDLIPAERSWREITVVHVEFGGAGAPAAGLGCTVLYDPRPPRPGELREPFCLDFGTEPERLEHPWAGSLYQALLEVAPDCRSDRGGSDAEPAGPLAEDSDRETALRAASSRPTPSSGDR